MKKTTHIEAFIRFVGVGGSFSIGYAMTVAALVRFTAAPPLITSITIYMACIPLAFLAQKKFAFRVGKTARRAILIYAATQIACLILVSLITSRFVRGVFLFDAVLFLITAGSTALLSYLICRFLVFTSSAVSTEQ